MVNNKADDQDKTREKKVELLDKDREDILKKKEDDDKEIEKMGQLIE